MYWTIDPRKSPEHAARREALKAEYEKMHGPRQPVGNPRVRQVGNAYVSGWHAHPFTDAASKAWAKLAARTTLEPLDERFTFVFINDKLYIVGPDGSRFFVPSDLPPSLTAVQINYLRKTYGHKNKIRDDSQRSDLEGEDVHL